jgi:hypothetical protein
VLDKDACLKLTQIEFFLIMGLVGYSCNIRFLERFLKSPGPEQKLIESLSLLEMAEVDNLGVTSKP